MFADMEQLVNLSGEYVYHITYSGGYSNFLTFGVIYELRARSIGVECEWLRRFLPEKLEGAFRVDHVIISRAGNMRPRVSIERNF